MKGRRLSFTNTGLSKDFLTFKQNNVQRDFFLYMLSCVVLTACSLVIFILETDYVGLAFTIALTLICLRYAYAWKTKAIELSYLNLFASVVVYSSGLYAFSSILESSLSPLSIFFFGYCFAQFQQVLQIRMENVKHIIASHTLMLIIRTFVPGRVAFSDLITSSYFIQIGLDIILIGLRYKDNNKEKINIKQFSDSRQEFLKFKELLTNHLPQNIMVLSHHLTPLFINVPLQKTFELEQNDPKRLKEQIRKLLDSLEVERTSLNRSNVSNCMEKLLKSNDSVIMRELVDYLVCTEQAAQGSIFSFESFAETKPLRKKLLFQVTMFNIFWDNQEAFVIILDDVTDREEVIALRVADTNKDKVIATISHELRTPLNGIIGLIKMALQRTEDLDLYRFLTLCETNAELLLNIVNSMLDLHQVRQGILRLNTSQIDLEEVLTELKALFEFQCIEKNLSIEYKIQDKAEKFIMTDKNRLKQILINLISNAIKFTFQGGITIRIEEEETLSKYLIVSVSDTGVGIHKKDKKKLFKMYGKLEETSRVNTSGIGLGLTISNNLARLLSKQPENKEQFINIDSELGKGSKFYFKILKNLNNEIPEQKVVRINTEQGQQDSLEDVSLNMHKKLSKYEALVQKDRILAVLNDPTHVPENPLFSEGNHMPTLLFEESPLIIAKPIARIPSALSLHRNNDHSMLIQRASSGQVLNSSIARNRSLGSPSCDGPWLLVVDDNPFNLLVAQNLLENIGYRVRVTLSGESALSMAKQHITEEEPFKLILMDCQMPIMDGYETTRELKAMMSRGEIPNIPIVALTANDTENDIKRCYESGMEGHLIKPLKEDSFRAVLLKLKCIGI